MQLVPRCICSRASRQLVDYAMHNFQMREVHGRQLLQSQLRLVECCVVVSTVVLMCTNLRFLFMPVWATCP